MGGESVGSNTVRKVSGSQTAYIGQGCRIIGDVELAGDVRVDGVLEGEVRLASGCLTIGEAAVVNAKIFAPTASIYGRVDGDIVCSERLEIHNGACVTGSISSPRLTIEDGVVFEGTCQMSDLDAVEDDSRKEKVLEIKLTGVESPEV